MNIGKIWISPLVPVVRFYRLLAKFWFIPFGFYDNAIKETGKVPHPLKPREFRDFILNKMMFPDNIQRSVFSDKIAARGYVAEKIGPQFIIKIFDICDTPEEIALKNYPYPYIVKTNHASGQIARVRNDAQRCKMLEDIKAWDAGEHNPKTEWAYHGIKRKFIIEEYLLNEKAEPALELYMHFFFGEPVLLYVVKGRETRPHKVFLTPKWEKLDVLFNYPLLIDVPDRPENLDKILELGKQLAGDLDYLRVDFFLVDDTIYFSELTSFTSAGQQLFQPRSFDRYLLEEYNRIRKERIDTARATYHDQVLKNLVGEAPPKTKVN